MKKFLLRFCVFMVPVIVFLLLPSIALYTSRESYHSLDDIVAIKGETLMGYAYNQENYKYFKWKSLETAPQKEVIALGSSRVLQFRKEMFTAPFYNSGYTIVSIADYLPFLKSLPEDKLPEHLIINLDQWMFNEKWDDLKKGVTAEKWNVRPASRPVTGDLLAVWKDLFAGKYGVVVSNNDTGITKIGLNANVNNKGFRTDGSMYYGSQIAKLLSKDATADDYNYSDTFTRIAKQQKRFEHADHINTVALKELDRILAFCKLKNIQLVAILPPYADKVNEKMEALGKYGYMKEIYPAIKPVFDKYGFEVYDFTHLSTYGSNDSETIDGFHGSEVAYQRLLVKMLEQNSTLKEVADLNKLKAALAAAPDSYSVYK